MITFRKIYWVMILLPLFFMGCKEEDFEVQDADAYAKVFLQQAIEGTVENTFFMKDEWYKVHLGVGYGGVQLPSSPIDVKLAANPSLVDQYNDLNNTHFPVMPEGSYRLVEDVAHINSGETNSQYLYLEVNPTKLTGIGAHILPVSLVSVTGAAQINEELKTVYYIVNSTYESNPYPDIERDNWKVVDFSTDEDEGAGGGRVAHALDGLYNTFWATQWRAAKPTPPHHITIDLSTAVDLHGLKLAGRVDAAGVPRNQGNPKNVLIETSLDNAPWEEAGLFTLENVAESTLYFEYAKHARYFRITVLATHNNFYQTHIAEINAF